MPRNTTVSAVVLAAMVFVGVYNAQSAELLALKDNATIIAGAANVIVIYFILALLGERACEVGMEVLTAANVVSPKDPSEPSKGRSERRLLSVMLCLLFATIISLAGLRLVEMILEVATAAALQTQGYFAFVDALLTALIMAGGSDGIHQIMRSILGEKSPIPMQS